MSGKNCRLPSTKLGKGGGKPPTPVKAIVGYSDRSLSSVNPNNEQFAPSDSCPIPQRKKMGGMV